MQRYILFVLFLCLQWVAQGQTDYEYRYWFDKDDANVQTGTFIPGTLHLDVDLSTLDASLHTIHIQVKNGEGEWSSPVTKYFVRKATSLTPLVYWLDNQASPLELSSQSGHFDLDVSALDDGIHLLRIQLSQKAEGSSSPISKFFFKMPMAKQTSLLSWFDADHENIKKLEYNGGKPFLLDVSEIADGFHVLYLQAMGQGGLSMPSTKMFIKIPQTEGVSYLTCACSIDGKLFKTEQVSSEGGIVNWNLDVAPLSQGIHNMQVQVLTPTGAATNVSNHFFFRAITKEELNNMKLVYSLDGKEFHAATGDAANGVFHFDIDVASLEDGLHRIIYNLASDNGTSTKVNTSFFWKTPIGGNGVMEYMYWLNDNEANAQVKKLDKRVSTFSLVTLLPVESQPIRSSCFQFEVKEGVPMMYAKNDFHIAFYDASFRRVDETNQFVDYNVSQKVEDIADLQSTQTFARPEANAVKWFKFDAAPGDTIAFRTSQASSLQVFAPSGEEIHSVSADKSVNYCGAHTWEEGTYYVAVHDVTGSRPNVTLDFMHMDRYDVVAQDVHTVGNGGCSTITFQGNGFRDLYAVDLYTANGDTIHSIDIGHESDASTTATFDFTDAELGKYAALFHFTGESKTFTSILSVEEARDIELATKVSYPSTFLRGSSVTYSVEITNKGNMTAYNLPVYTYISSPNAHSISFVKLHGAELEGIFEEIKTNDLLAAYMEEFESISGRLGDDPYFLKVKAFSNDINDSVIVRANYLHFNIPPKKTIKLSLQLISTDNVDVWFTIPEEWISISYEDILNPINIRNFSQKNSSSNWFCCYVESLNCALDIFKVACDISSIVAGLLTVSCPKLAPETIQIAITNSIMGCVSSSASDGLRQFSYSVCETDGKSGIVKMKDGLRNAAKTIFKPKRVIGCLTETLLNFGDLIPIDVIKNCVSSAAFALGGNSIYNDAKMLSSDNFSCKSMMRIKPGCPPNPPHGGSSRCVNSLDPNDIYGYVAPSGSKFVGESVVTLPYRIEFENDTAFATASAHVVEIKDTLDRNLFDLATFAPTGIKIGDKTEYLDGTPNFVKTIDMRPAINTIAQVEGKYDQTKGIATWTFTSLDPMTMEPTDDVMQGFLPVNYDGKSGIGEVSYDISLRKNLPDGTEIPNRAGIVFDKNEAILTPTWTNIVDAVPPTSHITGVEQQNDSILSICFEGEDARSGVWKYDVYVQYGKGTSWEKIAECAADSSYIDFRFYDGLDYGFCVLATDSAGNVEKKEMAREGEFVKATLGDVNMDGEVNTLDASLTTGYYLEQPVYILAIAADVNGDGEINTLDATQITQMYLNANESSRAKAIIKRQRLKVNREIK